MTGVLLSWLLQEGGRMVAHRGQAVPDCALAQASASETYAHTCLPDMLLPANAQNRIQLLNLGFCLEPSVSCPFLE